MTDRPILFNAPMVRAILAGTKTQTRRVVKPQPIQKELSIQERVILGRFVRTGTVWNYAPGISTVTAGECVPADWAEKKSPFGQPGDLLWVRETWRVGSCDRNTLWYSAGGPGGVKVLEGTTADKLARRNLGDYNKPSLHMPRWASRITLEVTGVRVELLNDISRGDAMAEGCPFPNMAAGPDPRDWYAELWDDINGPGSWSANPWVWVVEFQKVNP